MHIWLAVTVGGGGKGWGRRGTVGLFKVFFSRKKKLNEGVETQFFF